MSREYVLQPFQSEVHLSIDYAHELNPQQCAAVTAPPGPALVIAGAGSGKTRTLTYRVAYLLEQGIPPDRILLLTFTNKAAAEMMRRVNDLLGQTLNNLWGGTFHSIGNRVLRAHAQLLGYGRDFTILDSDDAKDLIKACVTDAKIETKNTQFPKPEVLNGIFSLAINTHKTVAEVLEEKYPYLPEQYEGENELDEDVLKLFNNYVARKRAMNAMDFDDLLALWLKLLQEHAEVRENYQRRFQFILVDEYQDTNKLQSDLIDLLADRTKNVMVVGDDAQSIYAWRGANFQNIIRFPERYPGAKIFKIETNYRSTPEILNVANAAIAANVAQFAKELAPARKSGMKPALVACPQGAQQQAAFVAQRALELHEQGVALNQIAVLYRSHFHSLELQMELTRLQIPFSITSGIRFFEQAHIKDIASYLKLITNPRDELAFKRLVLLLPGIGSKGAEKLWLKFAESLGSGVSSLENEHSATSDTNSQSPESSAQHRPVLATKLQSCAKSVPKKAALPWAQFATTISQLESPEICQNAAKMIQLIIEAGYEDYLKVTHDNYERRLEELKQLAIFAQPFPSLEEFLSQMALLTNVEAEDEQQSQNRDDEKIRLSTIHQAKGLEFDVVFSIMLCDGLFPSARSSETDEGLEEERRLFYVTITRAKNELYLCYPLMRAGYGGEGITMQQPSRFLDEIPKDYLDEWNLRTYG